MSLAGRTLLVLSILYGLVFALGDAALLHGRAPIWFGVIFVVVLIGAQYLLSPWLIRLCFTIDWDEDTIPPYVRAFVDRMCREHDLPHLPIGIIESGTPNAFAFGRLRSDARIVVTRGLVDILTQQETEAVLAHEIGHVAHYDFAVMAVASMAPLLLYQIYIWTRRQNNLRIVSYAAYISYLVGQYLVLLVNRTREFGADHFSAETAHTPNALASALVKISYGLVKERSEARRLVKEGDKQSKKDARKQLQYGSALALMGIMGASDNAGALALTAASAEEAARAMRWDLVNPWSRVYELSSTHPLTAMRLKALNRVAREQGQAEVYPLPQDVRVNWVGFPVEFLVWAAPMACGFLLFTWGWIGKDLRKLGYVPPQHLLPWLVIAMGVTWAFRIGYRYRGVFKRSQVRELIDDLGVSQMRPRAVEIEGEVIGHGVPGAFWSPDLVLRDDSGMMFLLYRSSIPLGRLFFALRSADRLVGERVNVQGWYRRGLKPYVEISRVEARVSKAAAGSGPVTLFGREGSSAPIEFEQLVERSYSRWIQLAGSALCTAIGVIWLMSSF
ncbi:MAG TPA: M48 family metalloprotease [Terracidiphilus sp.]|nr:M48 family metalloprotease [Terracidiphilus sp.]